MISCIVGSAASVSGLIALGAPRLSATDVKDVQADIFKGLASTMQSVGNAETRAIVGREQINRIEQERRELELLVRQTSLKFSWKNS
jgi:hypothetical protein